MCAYLLFLRGGGEQATLGNMVNIVGMWEGREQMCKWFETERVGFDQLP